MKNAHSKAVDGVMAGLLALGYYTEVGIPSWILNEMASRKTAPMSARDVLGLSTKYKECNIVSEYSQKKGYEFSWGTLSEDVFRDEDADDDDDGEDVWTGRFEVMPKEVLKAFPQSAMVEDLYIWMYSQHPLRSDQYEADESMGDWFVLSFYAEGLKNIDELRRWLACIFVPRIMPDLVREGLRIVQAAKAREILKNGNGSHDSLFCEVGRYQLCDEQTLTW